MQALAGTLKKRRGLGQIAGDAFSFYGADWRGFVTIGAGTIPASVTATLATAFIDDLVAYIPTSLALLFVSIGVYAIVEAAVISHLLEVDAGGTRDEVAAYMATFARLGDLLRASYRSFLLVLLLAVTVIGLILAIERGIRWIFVPHAVMIDGQPSSNALKYSAGVVRGSWWLTFGRVLFVSLVIGVLTGSVTGLAGSAPLLLYALVTAIANAFTGPYFSIALTLMYFDLKLRKDEAAQ